MRKGVVGNKKVDARSGSLGGSNTVAAAPRLVFLKEVISSVYIGT